MNIDKGKLLMLQYEPKFVNDIWTNIRDASGVYTRTYISNTMTHELYEIFDFTRASIRPTVERFTIKYEY